MSLETLFEYTNIDPWFLNQFRELHEAEQWLKTQTLDSISYDDLLATKQRGFSDVQIARCMGKPSAKLVTHQGCLMTVPPTHTHMSHNMGLLNACKTQLHARELWADIMATSVSTAAVSGELTASGALSKQCYTCQHGF